MSSTILKTTQATPQTAPSTGAVPRKKIVIAVDGPAASGKGTLARALADRLGYAYLDTGTLYRAVGLAVLETKGNPEDFEDVKPALGIALRNLTPELLASPALRTAAVADASSKVATFADVRFQLIQYQRDFAANPPDDKGGAVLDGRDIGTIICPEADLKLFVTASPEERARRRFEEEKVKNPLITEDAVLRDILKRDQRDSTRIDAPLVAAGDAYILDTTNLTAAQALDEAVATLRSKFLDQTGGGAATT